jgi:hypothetical protein
LDNRVLNNWTRGNPVERKKSINSLRRDEYTTHPLNNLEFVALGLDWICSGVDFSSDNGPPTGSLGAVGNWALKFSPEADLMKLVKGPAGIFEVEVPGIELPRVGKPLLPDADVLENPCTVEDGAQGSISS